jgi:hypothetical protein
MTPTVTDTTQSQSRESRIVTASTKVTDLELAELEKAASSRGARLGEWVRDTLLHEARSPSGGVSLTHVLTEVVALQLFLTEALSPVVCGQRMTSEQYDALLRNVKATKRRAAKDVIARYVAEAKEERHG